AMTDLADKENQFHVYSDAYDNAVKRWKFANSQIEDARKKSEHYNAELKLANFEAEVQKFSETFTSNTGSLSGLSAKEDEIKRQIAEKRAISAVEHDLDINSVDAEMAERESEERAEAKKLLEKFKSAKQTV